MSSNSIRTRCVATCASLVLLSAFASKALAEPEVVKGPAAEPECMVPWTADTKFFKFPAKKGPYRVALANGYIANTWRIQMIQTAKAYAAQPEVAAKLKEFKVVSTGEDVAAQISAINNFIDSGFDAVIVNAQNPKAFAPVIKRAKDAILNSFIFNLDTPEKILRERMAYEFYGYPPDFLENYRTGIEKTTREEVNRIPGKYLHKDKFAVLVVGNTAEFDKPLTTLGPVTTLDVTIPPPPGEPPAPTKPSEK